MKKTKQFLLLFLPILAITFIGMSLCNIISVVMTGMIYGFGDVHTMLLELPYLLYFILSLIISLLIFWIILKKK